MAGKNKRTAIVIMVVLALMAIVFPSVSAQEATETPSVEEKTAEIVASANAFLDTLDTQQREEVMFDFDDDTQRTNWSNFPTGIFTRAGVSIGRMTDEQRTATLALLQTVLSEQGYQKLIDQMVADEILFQTTTGGNLIFGYGEYYISFLGTPSETDPWMLQFGGHHFALNITFVGTAAALTPSHTGCQPCVYIINDREVHVLGDEYALALQLINSLDADAQAQAILDYSVTDLVLGPGEEDRVLEPEGLPASEMTADQQEVLMSLIGEWVNIANETAAAPRMEEIRANLSETYFAWSGDTGPTSTSYFRITGPTLLIEFAPQGNGGGGGGGQGGQGAPNGNGGPGPGGSSTASASGFQLDLGTFEVLQDGQLYHVHTIYRDPTNAYGAGLIGG